MKAVFYDPMFYICSEKMPFSIIVHIKMKETVDGEILRSAVSDAMTRYPYFKIKLKEEDGEILVEENDLPVKVFEGTDRHILGSADVNYHLVAFSYFDREIDFHISHVITDGAGSYPLVKTVMYLYLSRLTGEKFDSAGINLPGSPVSDEEIKNPYPEDLMKDAVPLCRPKKCDFFKLADGGYVNDSKLTSYRFRLDEKEVMRFNRDNDGSPCVLLSSIMSEAVRTLHPREERDLVCAVSFNMRPGLGNKSSYRMLCSSLELRYPKSLSGSDISKICTCSRGMVTLLSQPENVLFYSQKRKMRFEALDKLKTVKEKQQVMSERALFDANNNTFSISYVGKMPWGSMEQHLDSIYNETDGSIYKNIFLEVTAINGMFNINFLQGFSNDIYYRTFLKKLEDYGISYVEDKVHLIQNDGILLPGLGEFSISED